MKILLVEKDRINKYELPAQIADSFVINYKPVGGKECVLTLEAKDGNWVLQSNGSVNVMSSAVSVNEVTLVEYNSYVLQFLGLNEYILLYAMPTVESENYKLDFSGLSTISIGSSANCNICYHNNAIGQVHAEIKNTNGAWFLTASSDPNYKTFVNNKLVTNQQLLAGDVIFIGGLKIIWMGTFIQINNPNKQVTVGQLRAYNGLQNINNTEYTPVDESEQSQDLYAEEDYFYHTPRIHESVEEREIVIDSPPGSNEEDELPFILTVGSTITMLASTLMMGYNVGYGLVSGSRTFLTALPQIVMCVAMIIGSLILPKLTSRYRKKQKKEREEKRQRMYTEYLGKKEQEISLANKQVAQIMKDNSVSVKNCLVILNSNNRNFWSREISDDDFLKLRLGMGSVDSPIKINAPEEHFTLDEDNLLEMVYKVKETYKKINDVPIFVSLVQERIAALICECSYKQQFINSMILQLVALHSAVDLKIAIFTDEEHASNWEYMKLLPHCWSEDKSVRFFATNLEEMKDVSSYMEEELKKRKEQLASKQGDSAQTDDKQVDQTDIYKNFDSYFLIINDNYMLSKNVPIIQQILGLSQNYGFSYLVVESTMRHLPTNCSVFIEVGEKEGAILKKNINASEQQHFVNEYETNLNMREVANKLANVPTMTKEGLSVLPTSLSFMEMYGVSKVEQFNILNRWKMNSPVTSLAAPIGVYANGEQFKLNLHEKFHGPHGLIAGMTGSGKSEFIITYILSMCVNYHPYEVQFVLIDYKGGGLAGAFENKETGVRIPHLAGTITNLDTSEMNRTLVSIESELKRRQRVFNETKDALGESTVDIYKYQRLYREGMVKEPMSHLFIISDEFAELKSQQPEFMAQLISTARIGRSLGVHLILATQKPSGVVNDQIWSNSKFKVCLKVQDRSDSMEMLKRPEAASIKETGRFYLQVGYDDFFDKGQSGWAGAKYVPSDRIIKKIDDSVDFVNNTGDVIKSIKDLIKVDTSNQDYGDQLTNIVKYIYNVGQRENIVTTRLWLDAIPAEIFVDQLKEKYGYQAEPYFINPIIGEYDAPASQQQGLLTLNLTNKGNTLIMGQAGSGKENLITTLLWSTMMNHTPEEVNFYIIDCGTEALKVFNKVPHVGEIASIEDTDLTFGIFQMLDEEIARRKEIMADYAGDYQEFLANSGQKLPLIVTIINNYEIFIENYGKLADSIQTMYRDGARYGVIFIISELSPSTIKQRMSQHFPLKLCLQIPNEQDYRMTLGAPKGLLPARLFGRGIAFTPDFIYEFQTAFFVEKKNINNTIREAAATLNQAYTVKAKKIPVVPDIVSVSGLYNFVQGLQHIPVGYSTVTKEPFCYDFALNPFTMVITGGMNDERMSFVYALMKLFQKVEKTAVKVIDFVDAYEKNIFGVEAYKENFDQAIVEVNNEIMQNKDSDITTMYIILGAGGIKSKLGPGGKQVIDRLFHSMNTITNAKFILVDVLIDYKNLQVEPWFQAMVDNSYGIWLDADISSQLVINAPNVTMEERKIAFPQIAYVVSKGNHTIIKHVIDDEEVTDEK